MATSNATRSFTSLADATQATGRVLSEAAELHIAHGWGEAVWTSVLKL
jgi:hypothetical protein